MPPLLSGVVHVRNIEVAVEGAESPKLVGAPGDAANTTGKAPTDTEVNIINITNTARIFLYNTILKKKKNI